MNWREAFLRQARSEENVRQRLNQRAVAYCHRLHYLQMVSEKLARGFQMRAASRQPPPLEHKGFVRMLQMIKGRPEIRRMLGYGDTASFVAFVDSLLDLASRVERLAPSHAGLTEPNPEYPWWDPRSGEVYVPSQFAFADFDPRSPRMVKLEQLLQDLLRIAV
jgi:hypothetical protein